MTTLEKPEIGSGLTTEQFEFIFAAFWSNLDTASEKDCKLTLGIVLFNFGDRFTPIHCINGEWEGIKQDLMKKLDKHGGVPKCPNGHVLMQSYPRLQLGWVAEEEPVFETVDEKANGKTDN